MAFRLRLVFRVQGSVRRVSGVVGIVDGRRGRLVVPVRSANNNGGASDAMAAETEVLAAEGAVRADEAGEMARNVAVVANLVSRGASQVVTEATKAAVELLKDDCLSLDFADLFSDDPLGHLLQDDKALLDDLDLFRVADYLIFMNNSLAEVGTVEVVRAVEVVEVVERSMSAPVVKRLRGARS